MKSKIGMLSPVLLIAFSAIMVGCDGMGGGKAKMETFQDSLSYAIGADYARNVMKNEELSDIDPALVTAAIKEIMNAKEGAEPTLDEAECSMVIQKFVTERQNAAANKMEAAAGENLAASEKFLEENMGEDGVQVTESGLQYKVVEEGSGAKPGPTDKVKVHYEGKTIDGNVFDSSLERGEPIVFGVNQVIPGWTEGLQLMSPGAKYMFYIPSDLAYGARGAGQDIGPNQALIFEVQLIEINPAE